MQIRKKTHRIGFYAGAFWGYVWPSAWYRHGLRCMFSGLSDEERRLIRQRVDYYCRMQPCRMQSFDVSVRDFKFPFGQKKRHSAYFFDLYKAARRFDGDLRFNYIFGDVDYEPEIPAIVKSRPITDGVTNAVVMKLNSVRHFRRITDHVPFREKKDMLVSRNVVRQPHRMRFMEKTISDPMCNVGKINVDGGHEEWLRPYMTESEQLDYKFIACIEGNDVATNLKWVMQSNSLAVMPRPRFETWFMEGMLLPGVHYVEVKDDYSDLHEQMQHYISHPEEAEQIIENAHAWMRQFFDSRMERLIQTAVLGEYFMRTGQSAHLPSGRSLV